MKDLLEKIRHTLTMETGLGAFDKAAPSKTLTLDHTALIAEIDAALGGSIIPLTATQYAIVKEICGAVRGLGGSAGLLAAIGSWGDTLPEGEVLGQLRELNAGVYGQPMTDDERRALGVPVSA